jgi:hypothetical protein
MDSPLFSSYHLKFTSYVLFIFFGVGVVGSGTRV